MNIDNLLSDELCDFVVEKLTDERYIYNSNATIANCVGRQDKQWDGSLSLGFLSGLQLTEEKKRAFENYVEIDRWESEERKEQGKFILSALNINKKNYILHKKPKMP